MKLNKLNQTESLLFCYNSVLWHQSVYHKRIRGETLETSKTFQIRTGSSGSTITGFGGHRAWGSRLGYRLRATTVVMS